MVVEPEVLLLDEPFTGLDQILRWQLLRDLRGLLAEASRTYVLVSHEFQSILSLADRVGVMRNGTLVQLDTPDRIWRYPETGFTARLVGWSNVLPAEYIRSNGNFIEVSVGASQVLGQPAPSLLAAADNSRKLSYIVHPHDVVCTGERECQVEAQYIGKEDRPTDVLAFFDLQDVGVLRVRLSDPSFASRFTEGETVPLSWRPESALVVPD